MASPFVTVQLKDRLHDDEDEEETDGRAEDSPDARFFNASPAKTPLGRRVIGHYDSPCGTRQAQSDDEG
jgi:hypothetical protein